MSYLAGIPATLVLNKGLKEDFFNASARLEGYFCTGLPVYSPKAIRSLNCRGPYYEEFHHSLATNLYPPVDFKKRNSFC